MKHFLFLTVFSLLLPALSFGQNSLIDILVKSGAAEQKDVIDLDSMRLKIFEKGNLLCHQNIHSQSEYGYGYVIDLKNQKMGEFSLGELSNGADAKASGILQVSQFNQTENQLQFKADLLELGSMKNADGSFSFGLNPTIHFSGSISNGFLTVTVQGEKSQTVQMSCTEVK